MSAQSLQNVIQHYPTLSVQLCALGCAIPALEMALCAIRDIGLLAGRANDAELTTNLSGELAGAVTLGVLAANLFPYSTPIGVLGFTVYSLVHGGSRHDAYFCSRVIYNFANNCIKPFLQPVVEKIMQAVEYIWNQVIVPAATVLRDIVVSILSVIPLPEHPAWYVAAIVTLVAGLAITGHLPNIRLQSPIVIVR